MSFEQQVENGFPALKWPEDWKIYLGAKTVLPYSLLPALVAGMVLLGDVKASQDSDTSLLSLTFDDPNKRCVISQANALALHGLKSGYMVWDVTVNGGDPIRVGEGTIPFSPAGTGLPVMPSSIELSDLAQAIADFDALDTSGVATVAANIGAINTANTNEADIQTVAADIVAVRDVAADSIVINAVGSNINTLEAVDANETDIQTVASDLPAIQLAAGTLTMTLSELTLVLDNNTPVPGANYNTLYDAIEYAKTVLQVGGKLYLTLAAGVTITEGQSTTIDGERMTVIIQGANEATSIITSAFASNFSGMIRVDNGRVVFSDISIIYTGTATSSSALYLSKTSHVELDGVTVLIPNAVTAFGIQAVDSVDLLLKNVDIESNNRSAWFIRCYGVRILQSDFRATGTTTRPLVEFEAMSTGSINNSDFDGSGSTGVITAVWATDNSNVYIPSIGTIGLTSIDTDFNPPIDTYGNWYSRIVTVQ